MPEKSSRSDESRMFEAIGIGIQAFSLVEFSLGLLFSSLMRPAHGGMSTTVIEEARHIEIKLRIIRALGIIRLKDDDLKEFNNLINRVGRKADTRHKLAHWAVGPYPLPTEPYLKKGKKPKFALLPPIGSAGYIASMIGDAISPKEKEAIPFPVQRPLHRQELEEFERGCRKLYREITAFASRFPNIPTKGNISRPPSRPLKAVRKRSIQSANTKPQPES